MNDRPTYIASCSFGKDSLATIEQLLYEGAYSVYIGYDGEKTEYRIVTAEDLWEANEALNRHLKTIL